MHWKVRAAIQRSIARLPSKLSYATYYGVQRAVGGLRHSDPTSRLIAGRETWCHLLAAGASPTGKVFFEVGTGTTPMAPIAYWLMGAARTITFDLHPYVKDALVREELAWMDQQPERVHAVLDDLLDRDRFDELRRLYKHSSFSLARLLALCGIEYAGPADAANTGLPGQSVDFHTWYTVLEHVPPDVLKLILSEGNRIIRPAGLFVHLVDYSDHFSHSYGAISAINFLQYSDSEWEHYAGNQYMYANRLRHDDMLALFAASGHDVLNVKPTLDERCRTIVTQGRLRLHDRFAGKSADVLAIRDAWIVSRARTSGSRSLHESADVRVRSTADETTKTVSSIAGSAPTS